MKSFYETNKLENPFCRSNSHFHYQDITSNEYEHRIKLDPLGEKKFDIRSQLPVGHVVDYFYKTDIINEAKKLNAFEKAKIQEDIREQIKLQKYQKLLEKDKQINFLCSKKSKELKKIEEDKKAKLKEEVIQIIKDSLKFSKRNNPLVSMLPENIGEIIAKMRQEKEEVSLNLSHISQTTAGGEGKPKKNEFLSLLGVDLDNLSTNNVNVDIDKAWDFVKKWSKGRNVEEILRFKVVNACMSLAEKKASEKVKQINEKLVIYKSYLRKKNYEDRKKREEEERKRIEELKKDPKALIRKRVAESVRNKSYNFREVDKSRKKKKRSSSLYPDEKPKKEIIKLNAYNDVDEILHFIQSSKNLNKNKYTIEHFQNIKETKLVDEDISKLIKKNRIFSK